MADQINKEIVTRESAESAIEHMRQRNGPGRKAESLKMLVAAAPAVPAVDALTDAAIWQRAADSGMKFDKGQPVVTFARALIRDATAGLGSFTLDGLAAYEPHREYGGSMDEVAGGEYVKLADVQALLATPSTAPDEQKQQPLVSCNAALHAAPAWQHDADFAILLADAACCIEHPQEVATSKKRSIIKALVAIATVIQQPDSSKSLAHPADAGAVVVEQATNIEFMLADYHKEIWEAAEHGGAYDLAGRETGKKIVAAIRALAASKPQATPLEATSEQMGGAQVAKAEWRDKLRWSKANTDYHGYIAFTPGQLEHFVSMIVGDWEPKRAPVTESAAAPADLSGAHHLTPENIAATIKDLREIEDGTTERPIIERDWRTWAGVLARIMGHLATNRAAEGGATERKPLTDAESAELYERATSYTLADDDVAGVRAFVQAIEQHHGITGGGK